MAAMDRSTQDPDPADAIVLVRARVLGLLRDPGSIARLTASELDLGLRVMRRARLLGRLAWQLREQGFPDALPRTALDQLLSALVSVEAYQRVARWELDRLAWALPDVPEVPVVALKGCAYLLAGLPNARGRSFADVDLLAPRARLGAVEARLKEHGWQGAELSPYDERYYRTWAHELPPMRHAERDFEVDLHHNIVMTTARFRPPAELLLQASRIVPGSRFRVLAPVDMVLHAMTHLMYGDDLADALRELVDIDEMLRHYGTHEPGFWPAFWPRATQLQLMRPAFYGLRYARRWLDTPVPEAVMQASHSTAPPAWTVAAMDRLVPLALLPPHPDRPARRIGLARQLLYLRSHWVRMPAALLVRHLAHKLAMRRGGADDEHAAQG